MATSAGVLAADGNITSVSTRPTHAAACNLTYIVKEQAGRPEDTRPGYDSREANERRRLTESR